VTTEFAWGSEAPDLADAVIGYRQWRLNEWGLTSPFHDYAWEKGVNTALCARRPGHLEHAPAHSCGCGLHAWYRPAPRLGHATPALVGGAIAMWGDVELHPTGLRSQYACVVALVLPWIGTSKRRRVTRVGELLEVEIVPLNALTVAAERYGKPVSDALVPPG